MFRKTIAATTAAALLLTGGTITQVAAAPGSDLRMVPVIVNGQKVKFPDTEPYINTDGRTMVPVRFVSEKLGATVEWEADSQTAVIKYGSKTIRMPIGSRTVTVDGQKVELDTAAEFTDGRTMVPLRFVSEVLASKVDWDDGAHAVKVTDASYQAKIAAGEVALDPWGREYSKNWDANFIKLTDLENTGMYTMFKGWNPDSRSYLESKRSWNYKEFADKWAEHIRKYYTVQLNVDYRTIDADVYAKTLIDNSTGMSSAQEYQLTNLANDYVSWVKENKVIVKGFADPEPFAVFSAGDFLWMPTHFKFMVLSANDTSQTFMDNWKVSNMSDSFELTKGVWYDGYSSVSLTTNLANQRYTGYALASTENMFLKSGNIYRSE